MTGPAGLERAYRRLLAWYPQPFRSEREEEMVDVLMAGARPDQRRPGLADSANLIVSALLMRLRPRRAGGGRMRWADALALFSVAAPLFLVVADALEVAFPYQLRTARPALARGLAEFVRAGMSPQIGGWSLIHLLSGFDIIVACQVVIAALVLLGLRRTALAALALGAPVVYWAVTRYWLGVIPQPLEALWAAVYILEAAALIASPGPRRGRRLLTWRHAFALLLLAAVVQAATLGYDAMLPNPRLLAGWPPGTLPPEAAVCLALSAALGVVAVSLAVAWKVSRYFLLLLAGGLLLRDGRGLVARRDRHSWPAPLRQQSRGCDLLPPHDRPAGHAVPAPAATRVRGDSHRGPATALVGGHDAGPGQAPSDVAAQGTYPGAAGSAGSAQLGLGSWQHARRPLRNAAAASANRSAGTRKLPGTGQAGRAGRPRRPRRSRGRRGDPGPERDQLATG
jgi:hypothetical protein